MAEALGTKGERTAAGEPAAQADGNQEELAALLRKIQADTAAQKRYSRWRMIFSGANACLLACLLLAAGYALNSLLPRVDGMVDNVNGLLAQAQPVVANLQQVSDDLNRADVAAILGNVDSLVQNTEGGVEQAVRKLNDLDLDTLNQSIRDLNDVVSPLAKLFGGGN